MSVNDHNEWRRRQREEEERRRFVAMFDPRNYHPPAPGGPEAGRPPAHDPKSEEARRKREEFLRLVRDYDGAWPTDSARY